MVRTSPAMLNRSSKRSLAHDFRVNTQPFIIRYNRVYRFTEMAFVMLAKLSPIPRLLSIFSVKKTCLIFIKYYFYSKMTVVLSFFY
ncbi:hypothetical protein LEMLEM_LOCUS4760 [Lemmus lemmus]